VTSKPSLKIAEDIVHDHIEFSRNRVVDFSPAEKNKW
jgi:hypothetical protein